MAVNFGTGASVGQTGSYDPYVQVNIARCQKDQIRQGKCSFKSYAVLEGLNYDNLLNRIESNMGYEKNSLSWGRSVVDNDDCNCMLFQASNGTFAEADFKNNFFEIKSERQITSAFCDWSQGRPYDAYSLSQSGFTFYQLFSTGLGDSQQDSIYYNRFKNPLFRWGLTSIMQLEVPTQ